MSSSGKAAGGLSSIPSARAAISSGDVTTVSTSYAAVVAGGAFDLTVSAATGDVIEVAAELIAINSTANALVAFVPQTMNGSTPVNPLTAAIDGIWRVQSSGGDNVQVGVPFQYVLLAGDIFTGAVTLRLFWKVSAGTGTLRGDGTNRVAQWSVKNLKH